MSYEEYLSSLDEKSVWVFTKQETDFDVAFLSTKLFDEIQNRERVNIEEYFKHNHNEYGIATDRHRVLVISQLYGLITKTPFYSRHSRYGNEKPTAIYQKFNNTYVNYDNYKDFFSSEEYKILKTEQILKLKIHAIIDTSNNNEDYNVLPIIFIYKVLKTLKEEHEISSITLDQLYTYVMTCKNYKDYDSAVRYIVDKAPTSAYVSKYKSLSRVLTSIKNNINLFVVEDNSISINDDFDDYFYNNFMLKYDFEELHEQLLRDADYSYFLYNYQDFNINLIDKPIKAGKTQEKKKPSPLIRAVSTYIDETDDDVLEESSYEKRIDEISEEHINEEIAEGASSIKPVEAKRSEVGRKYKVNPLLGKIAIKQAGYCCQNNPEHETFISQKTKKKYMEAHHLIPIKYQSEMWNKYSINIDCTENILSLCPTCHRAFHYGTKKVKKEIVENMFSVVEPKYKRIGFTITLDDILKLYKVKE